MEKRAGKLKEVSGTGKSRGFSEDDLSKIRFLLVALLVLSIGFYFLKNFSDISVGKAYSVVFKGEEFAENREIRLLANTPEKILLTVDGTTSTANFDLKASGSNIMVRINENLVFESIGDFSEENPLIDSFDAASEINNYCLEYPCTVSIFIISKTDGVLNFEDVNIEILEKTIEKAEKTSPSVEQISIPILVLKYFPLDESGTKLDPEITGMNDDLTTIKAKVDGLNQQGIEKLSTGTKYHGYKTSATAYLSYSILESKEFLQAMPVSLNAIPWNPSAFRPDYMKMLNDINICDYVDNKGVKQVWVWGYHFGNIEPVESDMAMGTNSKSFWNHETYGDVSNSEQINDMPTCKKTYTLYNYNYDRGLAELLEDHGHHIEAVFSFIDGALWSKFRNPHGEAPPVVNSCGWTHSGPNSKQEYQPGWASETVVKSNCEDWHPDGSGEVKDVNCHTWYGATCLDNGGVEFKIWWMQNIPGKDNKLEYQGKLLRNWWEFYADFDEAVKKGKSLLSTEPEPTPIACKTTFDCPIYNKCKEGVCVNFCGGKTLDASSIAESSKEASKEASQSAIQQLNKLGYDVVGNADLSGFEIKKSGDKVIFSSETQFNVFDQAFDSFVFVDSKGNTANIQKRQSSVQKAKPKATHIVELLEKPLLEEKFELEKKLEMQKLPSQTIKEKIQKQLKSHEQRLKDAKAKAIEEMLKVNPDIESKIIDEYKSVFNGFSVDITEQEALELKEISSVKNVYRNEEVRALLEESVNQISADELWKLKDAQGNQITGKGVTIGIIDTGVDYTHPDLGSSKIEENKNFEKITENPMDFSKPSLPNDGILAFDDGKLAYPSGNKINIYTFKDKKTVEIDLASENLLPFRIALDGNILAYFAEKSGNPGLYFYNLETGVNTKVVSTSDIALLSVSGDKLVYGRDQFTYIYDIPKAEEKLVDDRFGMPVASGNLVAYPIPAEMCYDKAVVYNIETEEKKEINPPDIGPILDFKGSKIFYAACSASEFDPQWKTYYLYDINTGEYKKIRQDEAKQEDVLAKGVWVVHSWTNKGSIEEELMFFSKDVNAKGIIAYDQKLEKYAEINPRKTSYDFEAEGNKVCFVSSDSNIYCHDYKLENDYSIPDVAFNDKVIDGYDFVNNDNDPMDDHGHGTHVAATAAGNGILKGVAPDASIVAYKVLDAEGSGSFDGIIEAIERSVDPNQDGDFSDHLDIISLSLGGRGNPDDPLSKAIDNAVDAGVTAVVAAGNSGPDSGTIGSPGTARKAITVGAVDKCDSIAGFSSRGPVIWENGILLKPDVVAPGVSICAAQFDGWLSERQCKDDKHIAISGTSMATPHVSGAVALLLQAHPEWTPEMVKSVLMTTSYDLGMDFKDQGAGRINLINAFNPQIAIEPQSIPFSFKIGELTHKEAITIKNLEDKAVKVIPKVAELKDDKGNSYSFASMNVSELTIDANSQEDIGFIVDIPKNVDGFFEGLIIISYNGEDYRIPFIFDKLSKLTLKATSKETKLYPHFVIHNKNLDIVKDASYGPDFRGDSFTFRVPSNTYTTYAIGDFYSGLDYILSNMIEVPFDSEVNSELKIENARPFNVKAESLQGTPLKLYDWNKGFMTYNDDKLVKVFHYGISMGNKAIYLSNKPDNGLNTDVFVFFNGVPAIEEDLNEK